VGLIAHRKYEEAIRIVRQKNPLPAVCGRVCTHPCESKCKAGAGGGRAINIRALKRFLADYEMQRRLAVDVGAKPKNGKKVAVIGAGPAGLSAAYYLAIEGYQVVVFEALPVAGGMLAVGIPRYRLPKDILDYEIDIIRKAGVEIRTGKKVGKDVRFEDLRKDYDAVLIASGAHAGLKLGIPGEDAKGVMDAVEFLRKVSLGEKIDIGRKVMVIGGGNAAIDAARTAKRLGKDVRICYRRTRPQMPAIQEEVHEAIMEDIMIDYLVAPVKTISANGRLTGVELVRMQLGEFDKSGRPRPIPIDGSEFVVDVDTLIAAISQEPDVASMMGEYGQGMPCPYRLTKWNTIEADAETFYTGVDGVFACGDVVSGPDTVTTALANGRTAALMIDKHIRGEPLERTYAVTRPIARVEAVKLTDGEIATMAPAEIPVVPVEGRASNFDEVERTFAEEAAVREAKRCYRCDLEVSDNEAKPGE
jgi:NADH-quinone oxidoreductase subunit F